MVSVRDRDRIRGRLNVTGRFRAGAQTRIRIEVEDSVSLKNSVFHTAHTAVLCLSPLMTRK